MRLNANLFRRLILPGFAFKAVIIGGGYATGRELTEFFMPSGPRGGLYGMLVAMAIWSVICALTFLFAIQTGSRDYRTFFKNLLGPAWPVFEVVYILATIVIFAVFAAAAGAILKGLVGLPEVFGGLGLMVAIALITAWGSDAVERLFGYVSVFLYATYVVLFVLALSKFGDRTLANLSAPIATTGWFTGGVTYAAYNILGAVVVLPVVRHITSRKDAIMAGALAGPLAMLPAFLFFLCMIAFYPQITHKEIPSDFLLSQLGLPVFRVVFEMMILTALLESGAGGAHAINERLSTAYAAKSGKQIGPFGRLIITGLVLLPAVYIAAKFGIVALIARGYLWLGCAILLVYVAPLTTYGLWRIIRARGAPLPMVEGESPR